MRIYLIGYTLKNYEYGGTSWWRVFSYVTCLLILSEKQLFTLLSLIHHVDQELDHEINVSRHGTDFEW